MELGIIDLADILTIFALVIGHWAAGCRVLVVMARKKEPADGNFSNALGKSCPQHSTNI